MNEILVHNLSSPVTLAFVLGVLTKLARSEFALPKDVYLGIATYLLLALGLHGGVELGRASFHEILAPALATLAIGALTPVTSYLVLRRLGRFGPQDAAGIAAHYGSVSAVTFIAAQQFVNAMGHPSEAFMPTLLTLLESPGINIALAIGIIAARPRDRLGATPLRSTLHEVLTGRTMVLLVGGLVIGFLIGPKNWAAVELFYDTKGPIFKGMLVIFLLEMGVVAGARLEDLWKVGPFLLGFGIGMPLVHGVLGIWLGTLTGLSVGGATVLGAMAASGSYIAAPPAVRLSLPEANPTYSLTASLAITFPFNILAGIPIFFQIAKFMQGV
jgi:hypothetical protein